MRYELLAQPAATVAKIYLDRGETFICEVGAMIAMSTQITLQTTSRSRGKSGGGMLQGLRRMFSGESFFINHFTAQEDGQYIILGPSLMGDISHHRLEQGSLVVQGGSWMASGPGVEIDTTFPGLGKAFFSGEGAFWVKCSGNGDVFVNSFGSIYPVEVSGDYIVDTGHIVAFEDSLSFTVEKASDSWLDSFLSGEGLVCKFSGRGVVYCQSHNPPSFGQTLSSGLKPRS